MIQHKAIVTRIIDGDTIEVTILNVEPLPKFFMDFPKVDLRLVAINAPERFTEKGRAATSFLELNLTGREVDVLLTGAKTFDRYVAEVLIRGDNLSDILVEHGHAVYFQYK